MSTKSKAPKIHSFLVHPGKNEAEQAKISGAELPSTGKLGGMLTDLFERAEIECDIDIVFRPDENGNQVNPCRDLIVAYAGSPTLTTGRKVAERLQSYTTKRSGLGLLFLMKGMIGNEHKLVIARFPGDQGILAEEHAQRLTIQFIERIFMKDAKAYKSALYVSESPQGGFWDGKAVDRQITSVKEISDYWIREFLLSELRTTAAAGTSRFARAFQHALNHSPSPEVRYELIAAMQMMRGQADQRRSAAKILDRLGVSEEAQKALAAGFPRTDLMHETFTFDIEEFRKAVPYRSVELDNGAVLIAEDQKFSDVFISERLATTDGKVRYTTEGKVVEERLRKTK